MNCPLFLVIVHSYELMLVNLSDLRHVGFVDIAHFNLPELFITELLPGLRRIVCFHIVRQEEVCSLSIALHLLRLEILEDGQANYDLHKFESVECISWDVWVLLDVSLLCTCSCDETSIKSGCVDLVSHELRIPRELFKV